MLGLVGFLLTYLAKLIPDVALVGVAGFVVAMRLMWWLAH